MAKHHVFLHIGPDVIEIDDEVSEQLAANGVPTPRASRTDLDRADLEIRRIHKSAGLKRKDVEGAWAKVCRRTFRARATTFINQPGFWEADPYQAALALDGLHGLKVHLIVSAGEGHVVPDGWARHVKPERVHVVPAGLAPADFAVAVARIALTVEEARRQKSLMKLSLRGKRSRDTVAA